MRRYILFIIVFIIAVAAIWVVITSMMYSKPQVVDSNISDNKDSSDTGTTTPSIAELKTEKQDDDFFSIDIEYPSYSSNERTEIGAYVEKTKSDFMQYVRDLKVVTEPYALKMTTTIYTSPTTVTYKLETYMYTGGAHGGTAVATFTYDAKGTIVDLDDLFVSDDSLTKLSNASRIYFYKKLGDQIDTSVIDEGTKPEKVNFNTWYLTSKGITFIFQQYQIGPYVLGIQEFPLNKQEAKGMLNIL